MQDRYAGDVGDYIKLGLIRALAPARTVGVAWYLYPNESHNDDGKHVAYLRESEDWRPSDPELFDALADVVQRDRSVARLQECGVLEAKYFADPIPNGDYPPRLRPQARSNWFSAALSCLNDCNVVFADPDNGLIDDRPERRRKRIFGKQLPLSEAKDLAKGRTAVIYHHNTRFPGGHDVEVEHWLSQLGDAIAIRANAFSCRTFFVMNPDDEMLERCADFCARWAKHHVSLHQPKAVG